MSYAFDGFVVDRSGFRLLRDGRELPIERRAFDLLNYLIEHRNRVVSKQELLEQVWNVQVLSDGVLSNTIAKLRRVLGQRPDDKRPIETVHGRGYRFRALDSEAPVAAAGAARLALPDTPVARDDLFVGRDGAMRVLRARLLRRAPGAENVIVLSGEPGIGKTRTSRELAREARELGVAVWTGAAHGEGAPPYWTWIQVVRAAHEELGAHGFRDCVPGEVWPFAQLVPELVSSRPPVPAPEPRAARFRLFEAVSGFLKRASAARPLLVILDDLHCADRDSVELLRHAACALQEQPVTFLATLRGREPPGGSQEEDPLARLARVATVVELCGLSAEAVAELTAALTGGARSELALALHRRTQGNPLFVRQSLDLMLQRGDFSLQQELLSGGELPPAIRHIIRRRVLDLPEATRAVVAAAAAVGTQFDAPLLAELLQLQLADLLDRLEPALRLGVIEERLRPSETFCFAHVLVRDSAYEELGLRERGELHGRLAAVLARRHGADPRHLAAVAHHALRALPFDLEGALGACRRAAAAAREAASFDAAAHVLGAAILKLDQHGGDVEMRFRLLLELGADHFYAGLVASAWRAFHEAAEHARRSARLDLLAEAAPRLVDCLELGLGDPVFARGVVEQALALGEPRSDAVSASLLAQHAELAIELPAHERRRLLDEAALRAERSGAPEALLEVAHTRAILRDPTCLEENARAADQCLELLERYPAGGARYRSLRRFGAQLTLYLCGLTACDLIAADAALERCREIADSSHARAAQLGVELLRAGRALGDGRLAELEELILRAAPQDGSELPLEREVWLAYRMALLEARGEVTGFEALERATPPSAPARFMLHGAIERARWASLRGDLARARALLATIPPALLERMPVQHGDLGALCSLAELRVAAGELEAARAVYAKLLPYAGFNAVGPCFEYRGAVAHFLGLAARAFGARDAAREHFQHALALNRRLGMPHQSALSERESSALDAAPNSPT